MPKMVLQTRDKLYLMQGSTEKSPMLTIDLEKAIDWKDAKTALFLASRLNSRNDGSPELELLEIPNETKKKRRTRNVKKR